MSVNKNGSDDRKMLNKMRPWLIFYDISGLFIF